MFEKTPTHLRVNKYNVHHVHYLSSVCYHASIQLMLMEISLLLQVLDILKF